MNNWFGVSFVCRFYTSLVSENMDPPGFLMYYLWLPYRFPMGGFTMDPRCPMDPQFPMNSLWIPNSFLMGSLWIPYESPQGIPFGSHMDYLRIPCGFLMDSIRIPMDST